MPQDLHEHSYETGIEPRSVRSDGSIKWDGKMVFVGEAFAGEVVGIKPFDDGLWHVHLGPLRVGILHGRSRTIVPLQKGVTRVPGHGGDEGL